MAKYYSYKTLEGDTWDSIALDFYNDEYKASEIIVVNPQYVTTLIFASGIVLRIPVLEVKESEALPPWKRS
ncbi:MAG: tail protein X [Clostridiaceae bacterium]